MIKSKNEHGKEIWTGASLDVQLTDDHFHKVDMSHPFLDEVGKQPDTQHAFHCNLGSITVLDRMTGFSFGRDTETGFRDANGKFWLASGMFNIIDHLPMSVGDAIKLIKDNANNCVGY